MLKNVYRVRVFQGNLDDPCRDVEVIAENKDQAYNMVSSIIKLGQKVILWQIEDVYKTGIELYDNT